MLHSLRLQRGLSLVELMVSITLGLFLTLAVIQIFLSSRGVFRTQDSMSVLQENARFALAYLTEDIRMAGYMGCPRLTTLPTSSLSNKLSTGQARFAFTAASTLDGVTNGRNNVAATNTWDAVQNTDVISVLRARSSSARLNGNASGTSITIASATGNPAFEANDVIMISDCVSADIVSISQVSTDKLTLTVNSALSKSYGKDAEVFQLTLSEYFIRDTGRKTQDNRNINGLFMRQFTKTTDATTTPTAYELVEGVQDMQFEYGEDTNNDGDVDIYRNGLETYNNGTVADWARVVAVRIYLLMQSTEGGVATGNQAQVLSFRKDDNTITADGRLRQVFSTTASLRNRLP